MGVSFRITSSAFTHSSPVRGQWYGQTVHRSIFTTSRTWWRKQLVRPISTFRLRFRRLLIRMSWPALVQACLTITGFAQSPVLSTSLPPYQSLRYEEDWTYLNDKTQRSDAFDTLKYIPLNERWYLSLGSEARIRYEYFDQFNFGAGPQDDNGYLLQRYLVHADVHFGKRVRVFTQLQSAISSGRNGGPRPTDDDRLDTHQAFLDLNFGDEAKAWTLRVGRHEMEFGSGRLISTGEGLNVRRSFDGVRVIHRQGPWLINAQVDKLVSIKRGLFNDGPDWSQTFWGIGGTRPRPKLRGGQQFAYIGLDRKMGRFDQ